MKLIDLIKSFVERIEGMRKLFLCVLLGFVAGIPLLCFGYISGSEYKDIAVAAIASYCGSNVVERGIAVANEYFNGQSRPQDPGSA